MEVKGIKRLRLIVKAAAKTRRNVRAAVVEVETAYTSGKISQRDFHKFLGLLLG